MTVITNNSITGINSITAQAGTLNFYDTNGGQISIGASITGDVTGNVTGNVTGDITIGAGSTSAPSLAPSGDSNTGIFFPSADTIAFAKGGSESARFDSSGRLLLGTNTNRQDFFNFSSAYGARVLSELAGNSDGLRISYAAVRNSDSVDSGFLVFGKSRGTTVGSATVVQDGDALGEISFQGADGSELVVGASIKVEVDGTPGANDMPGRMLFRTTPDGSTSTTTRMTINSSGQTLVGTTESRGTATPAMLQVAGGNGSTTFSKVAIISGNNEDAGGMLLASSSTNSLEFQVDPDNLRGSSEMIFTVDATQRFYLNASGQPHLHSVNSVIYAKSAATGGADYLFSGYNNASTIRASGTAQIYIFTNGNIQNTNDSYGQISDIKLKENIVDAESQWDDFKAVRFRKYNFKEETGYETHTQLGVIAQELELVSPGLVYETPDRDEEGNDLGTTTKAVKSSILVKKALVALQEAMERIETLETQNAAILARLDAAGI